MGDMLQIKKDWSNWKVFLVSFVPAILLTPFLEPYYKKLFNIHSGGIIFPVEIDTYPGTAALLYIFLITLSYTGSAKEFKGINLFYFVIIPIFLVPGPIVNVLILEFVVLAIGFSLGKLLRSKLQS